MFGESLLKTLGFSLCLQTWFLTSASGWQVTALLLAWSSRYLQTISQREILLFFPNFSVCSGVSKIKRKKELTPRLPHQAFQFHSQKRKWVSFKPIQNKSCVFRSLSSITVFHINIFGNRALVYFPLYFIVIRDKLFYVN